MIVPVGWQMRSLFYEPDSLDGVANDCAGSLSVFAFAPALLAPGYRPMAVCSKASNSRRSSGQRCTS